MNRTKSAMIYINLTDNEELESELALQVEYKSLYDTNWQDNYISALDYIDDHWECEFTPGANAVLGFYSIRVTCTDFFQFYDQYQELDFITVINNHPTQPEISIIPEEPKTDDDLMVLAGKATDIETSNSRIDYWYHWYKDDYPVAEMDNITLIPHSLTSKGERWQCVVNAFDGDDSGVTIEAEVTILNTPPVQVGDFNDIKMSEDTIMILENKLIEVFKDADDDVLIFLATGHNNIEIMITPSNGTIQLLPPKNWFGTEIITFTADDNESTPVLLTMKVEVKPTNDLPEIVQIGNKNTFFGYPQLNFTVDEDEWLNLSVSVADIDGDVSRNMIKYSINITNRHNLFLDQNTLSFNPNNEDVGTHYIEISVTDTNETPVEYIVQDLRLNVVNVNDPPGVNILTPEVGKIFSGTDKISFKCKVEDDDLLIPGSTENFNIEWLTDNPEYSNLGFGSELNNISLPSGAYKITVEVIDSGGIKVNDSVLILVKDVIKEKSVQASTNVVLWLIIIIILIVIIMSIVWVITSRKKKKIEELGIPSQEVLQPSGAYRPGEVLGAPLTAAGSLQAPATVLAHGTQITPTPVHEMLTPTTTTVQPMAQLPPVQPSPQAPTAAGTYTTLSYQQKLKMLEERLVRGEIDQELYESLKAKFELERTSYQPPPQLPPAGGIATVSPQPVSTPQTTPVSQPQPTQQPPQQVQQPTAQPQPQPQTLQTPAQQQPTPQPTTQQPAPQPQITPQPQPTLATQPHPQPLTIPCPLCQQEIQKYTNPCPHCGGGLQWGG